MRSKVAMQRLQRLYERGLISYPRTLGKSFARETQDLYQRVANQRGVDLKPEIDFASGENDHHDHEALHVTAEGIRSIDWSVTEWVLGKDHALLRRLARRTLEAFRLRRVERPETDGLPDWARNLNWSRPLEQGAAPTRMAEAKSNVRHYTPEKIALEGLLSEGLGRPSTWVTHANKAVERGLVKATAPTPSGLRWAAGLPGWMCAPRFSREIESCIRDADHSDGPREAIEAALKARADLWIRAKEEMIRDTVFESAPESFGPSKVAGNCEGPREGVLDKTRTSSEASGANIVGPGM